MEENEKKKFLIVFSYEKGRRLLIPRLTLFLSFTSFTTSRIATILYYLGGIANISLFTWDTIIACSSYLPSPTKRGRNSIMSL